MQQTEKAKREKFDKRKKGLFMRKKNKASSSMVDISQHREGRRNRSESLILLERYCHHAASSNL